MDDLVTRPTKMHPGGAPDAEIAAIMEELNDLQTWAVLLSTRGVPKAREAMDLVQRVRCLIVERTYPNAIRARQALGAPHA